MMVKRDLVNIWETLTLSWQAPKSSVSCRGGGGGLQIPVPYQLPDSSKKKGVRKLIRNHFIHLFLLKVKIEVIRSHWKLNYKKNKIFPQKTVNPRPAGPLNFPRPGGGGQGGGCCDGGGGGAPTDYLGSIAS